MIKFVKTELKKDEPCSSKEVKYALLFFKYQYHLKKLFYYDI